MKTRVLTIDSEELYFSAAHYLADHPKCGVMHGHSYFIRKLLVEVEGFVDLGLIKNACKAFDHATLVPSKHSTDWSALRNVVKDTPLEKVFSNIIVLEDNDLPGTTVEMMGEQLAKKFKAIPGIVDVSFELYEGPIQGVIIGSE